MPITTKFDMEDDVGDFYPSAKFHYDPIRGFRSAPRPAPARAGEHKVTAIFFSPFRENPGKDFHDL